MTNCHQLNHLTHLKVIKCDSSYMNSINFFNIIWSLPKLIYCHLDTRASFHAPTVVSLSLKYVSILCRFRQLHKLAKLFQQTPNLYRLSIPFENLIDDLTMTLPSFSSLTMLKLFNTGSLEVMKTILLLVPNLTHLKVDTCSIHCNGCLWEELIDNHMPQLKVFRFRMRLQLHSDQNQEEIVDKLLDSFRSRFWLEKLRWYVGCHEKLEQHCRTILLYSLPYAFNEFDSSMLTVTYKSTYPHEHSRLGNDHSFTKFFNVRNLSIHFPSDKNFWSIVPMLHQLQKMLDFIYNLYLIELLVFARCKSTHGLNCRCH